MERVLCSKYSFHPAFRVLNLLFVQQTVLQQRVVSLCCLSDWGKGKLQLCIWTRSWCYDLYCAMHSHIRACIGRTGVHDLSGYEIGERIFLNILLYMVCLFNDTWPPNGTYSVAKYSPNVLFCVFATEEDLYTYMWSCLSHSCTYILALPHLL